MPRLGLVFDYPEEGWTSMDLSADMLLREWTKAPPSGIEVRKLLAPYRAVFTRWSTLRGTRLFRNLDRALNRYLTYPRYLRTAVGGLDGLHIVDHSYAHLADQCREGIVGVFCHDLDAFLPALKAGKKRRWPWRVAMAKRALRGLERASVVFYSTQYVRAQLERHELVEPRRLVQAAYGIADCFFKAGMSSEAVLTPLVDVQGRPYLLHVGSCVPRKRIDFLLRLFAGIRSKMPDLLLVKIGGEWGADHQVIIRELSLGRSLVKAGGLDMTSLASVYRNAEAVVVCSESEGFGLPVIEGLATGCRVFATDIAPLREVGGAELTYLDLNDLERSVQLAVKALACVPAEEDRSRRMRHVSGYTWGEHARIIGQSYRALLEGHEPVLAARSTGG